MAIERKWEAVPPQPIISDGAQDGFVAVSNSGLFKVKQKVKLFSDSLSPIFYQVKKVIPEGLILGTQSTDLWTYSNMSMWTTSDNAQVSAEEQERPSIVPDAYNRAMYEEEPAVAKRSILVDKLGRKIDSTIGDDGLVRLATTSDINIENVNVENLDVALDALNPGDPNPDNALIVGSENGLKTGTKRAFVNNLRLQVLSAHDRIESYTYADFGTKDQRITRVEYTSSTFPGVTVRRDFNYVLDGNRYKRTTSPWSIV